MAETDKSQVAGEGREPGGTCNWCGSIVKDIGPETTGMESWAGWHVFLCQRPGCGHEMSRKP